MTPASRARDASPVRRLSRGLCAAFFLATGILHLVRPKAYERIVPPGFGDPSTVVLISGLAEIVGGLALAIAAGRRLSRWWLVGLLIAVFPANVYMALEPGRAGATALPRWLLWARLPLQPAIVWWVWRVTGAARRVGDARARATRRRGGARKA